MPRKRPILLILVLLTALVPALADPTEGEAKKVTPPASQNVTVVRVQSLEALTADVARVAELVGVEFDTDDALEKLVGALGIEDLSWVDADRPLVAVMPSAAMLMGAKGIVAGLPVNDPRAALDGLGRMFDSTTKDEAGTHTFRSEDGSTSIVAMPRGNYLVIGSAANLVAGFDPVSAMNVVDFPPGSLAIDVFLEPVAPMALMGLQSGRMMAEQQMQQHGEIQNEEGEEVHPVDPMAMQPMMDLYFDLVENMINNTSRLQLSFEVGASDLMLHKRLVPRSGSTLEGLLAAQKGALPKLAALVEPHAAMAVYAGQVTFTPAFLEAMRTFMEGYGKAMVGIAKTMEANDETRTLASQIRLGAEQAGKWLDCYRGDFAGSYELNDEGSFGARQVNGVRDSDNCKAALDGLLATIRALPAGPDGNPIMEVTDNALTYGGVNAMRYRMKLEIPDEDAADDPAERLIASWFSRGLVTLMGFKDDLMIGASGFDPEAGFRSVVDRSTSGARSGGITPELFAPLTVGPGFFVSLDLARMLGVIAALVPEDDETQELKLFLEALPAEARPVVLGARLDTTAANFDLAVPLAMIEAVGAARAAKEEHAEPPAAEQPHPHG